MEQNNRKSFLLELINNIKKLKQTEEEIDKELQETKQFNGITGENIR